MRETRDGSQAAPLRRGLVRSVDKAATILLLVAEDGGGLSSSEVGRRLEMPVPTAYQLLETLVSCRLLSKDSKKLYDLGPAIGSLADSFHREQAPPEFLARPLRDLAQQTHETVYLTAWRGGDAIILAMLEGRRALRVAGLHPGTRGWVHARASGKLFLALAEDDVVTRYVEEHGLPARTPHTITDLSVLQKELRRIRRRRYALDQQEYSEGIVGLSAPVFDGEAAVAAYSIAVPVQRFEASSDELLEAVLTAASTATKQSQVDSAQIM